MLAPLFEETVYRGFLYRAFRRSFSQRLSVALIIGWTAVTHWNYYSHSWVAAFDLSALTLVQCHLREHSNSLWDCIIPHFAYNTSMLFIGGMLR
ncbi:MAG: CPBP family intramembrane metalloprotease [Verrucomicrobia bacterium]|nr:CPBP family intramembrane metalloprotease [Verrucomicrobiota bacterium]